MTLMAFDTGTCQVKTEIPLITEDDYDKPLLPVHLKTEEERTHWFETIHPSKPIVCIGDKCPLCAISRLYYSTEKLLPVYSMEDGVVKILRLPIVMHQSVLYHVMREFIVKRAGNRGLFFRTPFVVSFKGYTDGFIGAYGLEKHALFSVQAEEPLHDGAAIEARDNVVSRFLKDYRDGDLSRSANINMSERDLRRHLRDNPGVSPELADIADFIDSTPEFWKKTKSTGKLF